MSTNKFILASSDIISTDLTTDWSKCFICQIREPKSVTLVNPSNKKGFDKDNPATHGSYNSIACYLNEWLSLPLDNDSFPNSLRLRLKSIISNSSVETAIHDAFVVNKAFFHTKCIVRFGKDKLKRKKDQIEKNEKFKENEFEVQPKITRRSFHAPNFSSVCFFCEKDSDLIPCRTVNLNKHVFQWAQYLSHNKLLVKLSEGDMVATEAVYHKKCLTNLYNNFKNAKKKELQSESEILKSIENKALSDVISYVNEVIIDCHEQNVTPVFTQKSLTDLYNEKLVYYGADQEFTKRTHCTHLREKIMMEVPGLCEARDGRQVTLSINDDIGKALFNACQNSADADIKVIEKAAKIIRKYLFIKDEIFNCDVSEERQLESVPSVLTSLIGLILEGGCLDRNISKGLQRISCNISQIIRFNAVKQIRRSSVKSFHHSKQNEPPLPVVIGLMVHSKTRKKKLVERLANEGLSISYNRVMEIRKHITSQVCKDFNEEQLVCPPTLHPATFTTAAVDNIDHNPSSVTSAESFHGTSISIFQHPETGPISHSFRLKQPESPLTVQLPKSYIDIKPTIIGQPEYPTSSKEIKNVQTEFSIEENASSWLNKLVIEPDDPTDFMSFSAFYNEKILSPPIQSSCHLLPLITESVTSPAVVRHAMIQIMTITDKANPGQHAVITGDQPVYALGKQVQWKYPKQFENLIWLLGPLHIEKNFMEAIGKWLDGSGWTKVYEYSTIATSGKAHSFLTCSDVSGVKRSRYAHQVTLAALQSLATESFNNQTMFKTYDEWRDHLKCESPTAKFWFNVMDMQIILFMFIRSLRESNFRLFIQSYEKMLPWLAVLDHVHYFRWGSIFLNDMKTLPENILQEFIKGNFTVKKTNRPFSSIGIDQTHEQNNKILKIDGGAIGLLDDEKALLEWAISGPIISNLLDTHSLQASDKLAHHESTQLFEKKFRKHRSLLITSFEKFGSPFNKNQPEGLMNIVSNQILDISAAESVMNAYKLGVELNKNYQDERLLKTAEKTSSIYSTIHLNKLVLFRSKNKIVTPKGKLESLTMKERVKLYANLYVGCQSRQANLDDFFRHENHAYPPALSEYGIIRKPTLKSDFLKCLPTIEGNIDIYIPPVVDAIIVDGPALIQMNSPKSSTTFGEYCEREIIQKVISLGSSVERIDVVFDVYNKNSRKRETREARGKNNGIRINITKDTQIYKRFDQVLSIDENKTELNQLVADSLHEIANDIPLTIVITREENIVSNKRIDTRYLSPCYKEEADDRMFLHAKELSRLGHKKLMIITVDSDVVVIALFSFWYLNIDELWIEFGKGKDRKWLPIHYYANVLSEEICMALPFWFAFTGCDTVSQFLGKGKKSAWKTWRSFPEVTETFSKLSLSDLSTEDMNKIERYVVLLYDRCSSATSVNECRKLLFTQHGRSIDNCPPTRYALIQHTKRAMLQNYIWTNCMTNNEEHIEISDWGWKQDGDVLYPLWTTLPEASNACHELKRCSCKKGCRDGVCSCKGFGLSCTVRCYCGGFCC